MLTFFEYLRQRAFESVLAGAHEALDLLERQQTLAEPTKLSHRGGDSPTPGSPNQPRKREGKPTLPQLEDSGNPADDQPLPAPRNRGHGTNASKGGK